MKLKTLLLTVLLSTSLIGTTYADFNDGWVASQKGDYKTAFKEWKPLAEQGNADAQHNLGWLYNTGKGVLKDYKEAVKWYRKAAEQGNASAQYNLGVMYDNGEGVLKDYKEAVKWYRKAAEQGKASAQYNLGTKYANGDGVLKDLSKAKHWIKKAYDNPDAKTSTVKLSEEGWNKLELWKY